MLIYLFIITIVYEIARTVGNIVNYRSMKRTNEEKAPEDPARVNPEIFDLAFGITIGIRITIALVAAFGLFIGGHAGIACAVTMVLANAVETFAAVISWAKGTRAAMGLAVYHFTMMMLFTWCVAKALQASHVW
jgi:hypothetical protein